MPRSFCIPGIVILALALVCGILASISLPYLPALEVSKTKFRSTGITTSNSNDVISELRTGIWSYCWYAASSGDRTCRDSGYAYSFDMHGTNNAMLTIKSQWTRGLVITPIATAVAAVAFLLSFSTHLTVTLVASLTSFLAATLMMIAFICDIALYAWVKAKMNNLGVEVDTKTGAGFWLTFASMILLTIAGCTVCFGRRRDQRLGSDSRPVKTGGFFSRFRRNRY
ncbi:hypothetical protein BKA62DRAFT_696139 [Auriculariales sp. MPI-PUGE-AT-0066]|nr:hypothetical protein BKA62DRAFT_696139 [Auriculariales sp. MPI-PUGE-AT-0066]